MRFAGRHQNPKLLGSLLLGRRQTLQAGNYGQGTARGPSAQGPFARHIGHFVIMPSLLHDLVMIVRAQRHVLQLLVAHLVVVAAGGPDGARDMSSTEVRQRLQRGTIGLKALHGTSFFRGRALDLWRRRIRCRLGVVRRRGAVLHLPSDHLDGAPWLSGTGTHGVGGEGLISRSRRRHRGLGGRCPLLLDDWMPHAAIFHLGLRGFFGGRSMGRGGEANAAGAGDFADDVDGGRAGALSLHDVLGDAQGS